MPQVQVTTTRRVQETCRCKAYPFPHREGSGKCFAAEPGPYCGSCGESCNPKRVDAGIGSYEFWGQKSVDSRMVIESDCCGADCFTDAELRISVEGCDD